MMHCLKTVPVCQILFHLLHLKWCFQTTIDTCCATLRIALT